MARKKRRPSKWIFLFFTILIFTGTVTRHWEQILAGCSGITVMVSAWILFRNVVYCDVKNRSKAGFCTHQIKGALFGCGEHQWDKVAAWSRYLGTGYIARLIHVQLPYLRWQANRAAPVQFGPHFATSSGAGTMNLKQPAPAASVETQGTYSPSIRTQAASFYVTFVSGVATIAGLGLSIAQVVK